MPTATPAQIALVEAYVRCGSAKAAAECLGVRPDTYRQRLSRVYARFQVTNMGQLVYVLRFQLDLPDVTDVGMVEELVSA